MSTRQTMMAALVVALMATGLALPVSATELTVLNPSGAIQVKHDLAPRLATLNGKTVAMWLSGEELEVGHGGVAYEALAQTLKEIYPSVTIVPYTELPISYSPQDEVLSAILAKKPDAVIVGFGG